MRQTSYQDLNQDGVSNMINKYSETDDIPEGYGVTPTAPAKSVTPVDSGSQSQTVTIPEVEISTRSPSKYTYNSVIKQMQQAILDLADVAAGTDITDKSISGNQNANQKIQGLPSGETPNVALNGTHAFGEFLISSYAPKGPGDQYLNTDVRGQQNRADNSEQLTNIKGLIISMRRVGTPGVNGGETSPDGVWKGRTDHALQLVFKLASAILGLSKDMGIKLPAYSDSDLATLKTDTSYKYTQLSPAQMNDLASKLIPEIKLIGQAFTSFKDLVLNNSKYRPFIDQSKPITTYTQGLSVEPPTTDQTKLISNTEAKIPSVFTNVDPSKNWASLGDLKDKDSFYALMKRIGKNPTNPQDVQDTLAEISTALASK
jgi:hypothetical protein